MGTSGLEIQLSRTGCLIINIPSNGSSVKVCLLFHQPFPCGLDTLLSSCSSHSPSLVEKQWGQMSWGTYVSALPQAHSPRLCMENKHLTSTATEKKKQHLRKCSRKYVYIASIGQVQGGKIYHHKNP